MLFIFGGLAIFVHRRAHRRDGRAGAVRLSGARHLLRRRPPALRADRRRDLPDLRRPLLLLPAASRQAALRAARADRVLADVRRLQRHVLADAPHRAARHAAARLHLSGGIGSDALNLVSTIGAFILAPGIAVVVVGRAAAEAQAAACAAQSVERRHARVAAGDARRSRGASARFPEIDSRYPLWDQPNFVRDIDEGRFYLPDAEEGRRETLVTSAIDAKPRAVPALRRPDASSRWSRRVTLGGFFIFGTFHLVVAGAQRASLALGRDHLVWLWTGTARDPREGRRRTSASACTLPLYASGRARSAGGRCSSRCSATSPPSSGSSSATSSSGRIHADFPPRAVPGPGVVWPSLAAALSARRGRSTVLARRSWNAAIGPAASTPRSCLAVALRRGGAAPGRGPAGSPRWIRRRHVYPAIVWMLVVWTRRPRRASASSCSSTASRGGFAGRMTAQHDIDIHNVVALLALHRRSPPSPPSRSSAVFPASGEAMMRVQPKGQSSRCGGSRSPPSVWAAHFSVCYVSGGGRLRDKLGRARRVRSAHGRDRHVGGDDRPGAARQHGGDVPGCGRTVLRRTDDRHAARRGALFVGFRARCCSGLLALSSPCCLRALPMLLVPRCR